jgi:basic membrane protein A
MRKRVRLVGFASFLTLFALLITACGGTTTTGGSGTPAPTTAKAAVTAAVVTDIGGLNDGGFNQFSHLGYEKARQQYGFPDVVIQSQKATDTEYIKNLTTAAQQADMVIGVGFLMEVGIYKVATQFPNKKFALIDGCAAKTLGGTCVPLPNVAQLFFKEQQAGCLVGAMAGQMEMDGKSKVSKLLGQNTIGAIGGIAVPAVVRYIAGYKYCAQKVDPSVKMVIGYSNNFSDPTKCSAIADKQVGDNKADILFQVAGGCGLGVLDSATKHNVYSIGVDVDQSKDSTGAVRPSVITSAIKRVDTATYDIINLAETGGYAGFVSSPKTFDITNDGVGYAPPSSDVPQDAVAKAMAFADMIKSGSLTPPEAIP